MFYPELPVPSVRAFQANYALSGKFFTRSTVRTNYAYLFAQVGA
ncbi:hypothetical protein FMEAI12_5590028 [Parafrankia sp. Ea1.12]|nr:hypothetical protein FMEAI12_5590028 [Parafrankia sp. Ea1.12]